MTNSILSDKLKNFKQNLQDSISKVSKENNEVDWNKEEVIIERLQSKLGKSKEEVSKLISKNLLDLLTMVPFSSEK
jgi:hypothetical protein